MAIGLIGKKSGMTRIFNEEGVSVPVTVIEAEPNRVTQVKSLDNDGYVSLRQMQAVVAGFGSSA